MTISPGPWKTDEDTHDQPYQDIRILDANGNEIAKIWIDDACHDQNAERTENARLMAKAWELQNSSRNESACLRTEIMDLHRRHERADLHFDKTCRRLLEAVGVDVDSLWSDELSIEDMEEAIREEIAALRAASPTTHPTANETKE